ncbi:hypothetical protein [Paeniglutamicibacter sp. Y32M11]|uniref:hypothetical protein n=1 Tax=Paeniglutamicibacter sp. Y32M11 TaxID=2853258 RepID=UPI001C531A4D|nr:hypothetical protein [Paeniglutamicibacter sp. Y32M11]QXQ08913.1 hypothetical protein KUF55_10250 [Paeniglutamicibacter sp. Y32M11]
MSSLSSRYVTAVSRSVPESQREDVEAEVTAAIADLREARLDAGTPQEDVERAVLLELGDPMRLAADYSNKPLHLIGPDYFPTYIRLLKILAATVLPVVAFAVMLGKLLSGGDAGEIVSGGILAGLGVAMHMFFWVTLIFALIERNPGSKEAKPKWDPTTLPDTPAGGVRLGDTIAAVLVALIAVAYLPWQHFNSPFMDAQGQSMPTLNTELWPFWIPLLMAGLLATAVLEFVRYRAGGWSWRFVAINTILELLVAVPVVWLAATDSLFEPRFIARLVTEGWSDASLHLNVTIIIITIGVVIWNLIDPLRKVRRDTAMRAKPVGSLS